MKLIKYLIYYLKNKEDINRHYGWSIKDGFAHNEEANWLERKDYWFKSE
jgi:hypothetical protein